MAEVVVPDIFRGLAFGEEEDIGFDTCTGGGEDATGQADDTPEVAFVEQFAFGLYEGFLVGAKEKAFIEDDATFTTVVFKGVDDVLEKEALGSAGFKVEVGLGLFTFLAAERRIGEDDVVLFGGVLE